MVGILQIEEVVQAIKQLLGVSTEKECLPWAAAAYIFSCGLAGLSRAFTASRSPGMLVCADASLAHWTAIAEWPSQALAVGAIPGAKLWRRPPRLSSTASHDTRWKGQPGHMREGSGKGGWRTGGADPVSFANVPERQPVMPEERSFAPHAVSWMLSTCRE